MNLMLRKRTLLTAFLMCALLLIVSNLTMRWFAEAEPSVDTSFVVVVAFADSSVVTVGTTNASGTLVVLVTTGCVGGGSMFLICADVILAEVARCGRTSAGEGMVIGLISFYG